jgi:hypothetical protein
LREYYITLSLKNGTNPIYDFADSHKFGLADSWYRVADWSCNYSFTAYQRLHRYPFELCGGFADYLCLFTLGGLPQKL